ncbi:PAS domain-containing protein [Chlorobaculum limnaeum]|uniref:PAS domain-containing protein n=1 Tax=Chlorobaculum limnaeum TaxID=274537 RepID=UPI001F00F834|nr:PAS domain-containing protein [Chlorobaculum limnaeum]
MDRYTPDSSAGADNGVPEVHIAALEKKIAMLESRASFAEQQSKALEVALESARAGCWEWDRDSDTIRIDRQWAVISGIVPGRFDALTLEEWRELCHPDDLGTVAKSIDEYLNGNGELLEFELRVRHDGDGWIRVLDRGKITRRDPYGKPSLLAGSRQIITDRLDAGESRAKKAQEELQALIDHIPGAVYHIDMAGQTTIRSSPPEFLKALASGHQGTPLFNTLSMIHHDDRHMVAGAYSKLKEAPQSRTLVYRIVTPEGGVRWIEDHMKSSFSDDGLFSGIDGLLCEITDRINGLEEAQRLESQLRKSQRLETIGTLAGGIAHDFNNILTPILGYAEMGLSSTGEEDPMHEYFAEITQAVERAQKLVGQILTLAGQKRVRPCL